MMVMVTLVVVNYSVQQLRRERERDYTTEDKSLAAKALPKREKDY